MNLLGSTDDNRKVCKKEKMSLNKPLFVNKKEEYTKGKLLGSHTY